MRKKGVWLLSVVLCLLLAFSVAGPAFADGPPPLPHSFYGTVTIAGEPAAAETVITAKVAGVQYGSYTTTVEGQYGSADPLQGDYLVVQGYIDEGATIDFYIGGVEATEKAYFCSGTLADELNLTAGAPETFAITATAGEGGSISPSGEVVVNYGDSEVFTITADAGYEVEDVLVDGESLGVVTQYMFEDVTADHTIHASFVQVTYDLTVDSTAGGSVTAPGEGAFPYDPATVVNLVAEADASYQFLNWTGDVGTVADTSAASTTIIMNGDYAITANFGEVGVTYDLTVDSTAGGSVTAPGEGVFPYDASTVVDLLAVAGDGYQFINWTGDVDDVADASAASTTITMNGDYAITANFAQVMSTVHLMPGWNIISTPIALDPSMDTWGEFSAGLDLDPSATTYYFDGSSQLWGQVLAGYELKPCDAIYVKMASEDAVTITASSLPSVSSKQLYAGWNLVGLAYLPVTEGGLLGMKANEALISVEKVTGDLTGYVVAVSPPVNQYPWVYTGGAIADWTGEGSPPDGWMLSTYGYWVFMVNDGTLAGFTFTPLSLLGPPPPPPAD